MLRYASERDKATQILNLTSLTVEEFEQLVEPFVMPPSRRTHMKASQHTAEQIIKILEHAEKGDQTIGTVCRTNGIAENTFYRWRKIYGGLACP
jgi:hypothetical protein